MFFEVPYGHVLAAAGRGLREALYLVTPARAAGGQQERKGKDEKGRKDIRFSVHRLTPFLYLTPPPSQHYCRTAGIWMILPVFRFILLSYIVHPHRITLIADVI